MRLLPCRVIVIDDDDDDAAELDGQQSLDEYTRKS